MKRLIVFAMSLVFLLPVAAKQDKVEKAGGARADHVSDKGVEKGKAWAGGKAKKGAYSSKSRVSGSGAIIPYLLEISEKFPDKSGIKIRE